MNGIEPKENKMITVRFAQAFQVYYASNKKKKKKGPFLEVCQLQWDNQS